MKQLLTLRIKTKIYVYHMMMIYMSLLNAPPGWYFQLVAPFLWSYKTRLYSKHHILLLSLLAYFSQLWENAE